MVKKPKKTSKETYKKTPIEKPKSPDKLMDEVAKFNPDFVAWIRSKEGK